MIVYILANLGTPGQRQAEQLVKDLAPYSVDCEIIDADSPRGVSMAEQYDILVRPAVILAASDGSPVETWTDFWPLAVDVSHRYHN